MEPGHPGMPVKSIRGHLDDRHQVCTRIQRHTWNNLSCNLCTMRPPGNPSFVQVAEVSLIVLQHNAPCSIVICIAIDKKTERQARRALHMLLVHTAFAGPLASARGALKFCCGYRSTVEKAIHGQ
jgi:hypothetical protein